MWALVWDQWEVLTTGATRSTVYNHGNLCVSMTSRLCQFLRLSKLLIVAESDIVCGLWFGTSGRC